MDLLTGAGPEGAGARLLRIHHVALADPFGYNAGLLHVVEPEARPHSTRA
ncbi:MAG TPA: hypothetical protein VF137_05305 [Candidatus Dormibacteraeota bacterium]